jgi:hypothetical protein
MLVQRPVSATLMLGLLNGLNLSNMLRYGCTRPAVSELLFVGLPFVAGLACAESPWFSAVVMIIPVIRMPNRLIGWGGFVVGYGALYLGYYGLVLAGKATRKSLLMPMIMKLRR